jgi:predicted DNA binding CopG/RHH family protein
VLSGKSQPVTIRLETLDLNRAKQQAARKGIGYQTYIESLLHQALEAEAKADGARPTRRAAW